MEVLNALLVLLKALLRLCKPQPAKALLLSFVKLSPTEFGPKGSKTMQMTDLQQAVANIEAVDAEGNPAKLKTPPTWTSSDPSIVIVTPSPDGMSAVISSPTPGPLGAAVITVDAGVVNGNPVQGTLAVDIVGSDATQINITTQEPTP